MKVWRFGLQTAERQATTKQRPTSRPGNSIWLHMGSKGQINQ